MHGHRLTRQYQYVNGRIVRTKPFHMRYIMAMKGILHGHQHSSYLLFLEVDLKILM